MGAPDGKRNAARISTDAQIPLNSQSIPSRRARLDVARLARGLRLAARRVRLLVAVEAAAHARELIARRELELSDVAVALRALDVPREVLLVSGC